PRDPDFRPEDIYPLYWETARYGDRIWSLPFAVSNVVLYYNEDLLTSLGLTQADIPTTWEEMLALADRLPPRGQEFWILDVPTTAQRGVAYYFLITLWQHGGEVFSPGFDRVTFADPAGVATLTLWQQMVERGIIDLRAPDFAFESGRVLFQMSSSARILSSYQQLPFR